jgi:hypothetical protein
MATNQHSRSLLVLLATLSAFSTVHGFTQKCANNACLVYDADNDVGYCPNTFVPATDPYLVGSQVTDVDSTANTESLCANAVNNDGLSGQLSNGVCTVYDNGPQTSASFTTGVDFSACKYYRPGSVFIFFNAGQPDSDCVANPPPPANCV